MRVGASACEIVCAWRDCGVRLFARLREIRVKERQNERANTGKGKRRKMGNDNRKFASSESRLAAWSPAAPSETGASYF